MPDFCTHPDHEDFPVYSTGNLREAKSLRDHAAHTFIANHEISGNVVARQRPTFPDGRMAGWPERRMAGAPDGRSAEEFDARVTARAASAKGPGVALRRRDRRRPGPRCG